MKGDAATVTSGHTSTAGALTPKHLARKMQRQGISSERPLKTGMAQESSAVEQEPEGVFDTILEGLKETQVNILMALKDVALGSRKNNLTKTYRYRLPDKIAA